MKLKKFKIIGTSGSICVPATLKYTANVYTQMTDKLLFLYAIITHENM